MRASHSTRAIALCLAVSLLAATAAAAQAQALRLGGTGSALGMMRQVGAEFTNAADIKIDIVPSLGSAGAIRALADGKLDMVVSARPLKADEAAAGLSQVMAMRTAYVFATSHRNPAALQSADLPQIFTAENAAWADGTPIRIILRPRSETDTALLGALFPGLEAAIVTARQRAEVPTAATDQDNVNLAERMPGSLIGTSAAQLATEHPNLRPVPLDGVLPTFANFESGAYPFAKELYVIVRRDGIAEAQRFVDFLGSPQGVRALRETETLPGTQ